MTKATNDEINYVREKIWNENSHLEDYSKFLIKTLNSSNKEEFIKILAINSLPEIVGREWLYSLFNIDGIDVVIKSFVYNQIDSKNIIDKTIVYAKDEISKNEQNPSKFEKELFNYEILNEISNRLNKTNEKLLSNQFLIVLRNDSEKELLIKSEKILFELNEIGCSVDNLINNQLAANHSINFKNKNLDENISCEIISSTMGFGFPFYSYGENDINSFELDCNENKNLVTKDGTKNSGIVKK